MATDLRSDPDLVAIVAQAQAEAERSGDLRTLPPGRINLASDVAASSALARWGQSGGYRSAVAAVAAADPDLADQ